MDNNDDIKAHLTYIWTIEKSSALNVCMRVNSPESIAESMEMTAWHMYLLNCVDVTYMNIVAKGLFVVYGVNSPTRRIMENEGQTRRRLLKKVELTLILFSDRESDGEDFVRLDIETGKYKNNPYFYCEIAILDDEGAVAHCKKHFACKYETSQLFKDFFKIQELQSNKDTLLPNDVLTLRCEFEFRAGPVWSIIENHRQLASSEQQDNKSGSRETFVEETNNSVTEICPFTDAFYKFYLDKNLTDVVLQTSTELFPVHMVVLCCRSEVLSVMLTENVNEKTSVCVDVAEDADTLRRLLLYIYTNEVQEMQWESAADLFKAADKYELSDLKRKCLAMLKSNISVVSFCSVLSIADRHQVTDLFDKVLRFMSRNLYIFKSEAWKIFKREKPELAFDASERIIYSLNNFIE
ncbi:hypothetical protein AVEN_57293-1 [Araneus ventricosus]|uniref:BTB domain-containing protein n=1 Tax=Araneus ventricosus TaxID=182803 RepID=A0A4Y2IS23_ARAVE|nr:hypothetical protein AVEN_57293-1 [Araneus ventricosus]